MTDPRFTDPRYSDPRLSDPVIRRDETTGGLWGWIAGVAVVLLIGFLIVAGWNNNGSNTASSGPTPTATTSTLPRNVTTPSTTGSGSPAAVPLTPAPSQNGTR